MEERDGDFWCDCYEGIRGRMCEHTAGMHFRQNTGRIPVTEDVRSLPISQKRPRGRLKQLPKSCLTRSPPKATAQAPALLDVSTELLESAPGGEAPAREVLLLLPCTSCQEAGKQAVAVVFCATCTDQMCLECNTAHSKLRVTKGHVVTEAAVPEHLIGGQCVKFFVFLNYVTYYYCHYCHNHYCHYYYCDHYYSHY